MLCLSGCDPGGNQGSLSTPDSPSVPAEQQAIQRLLELYREAVLAEDIDRLQALLQPTPALAQAAASGRLARQATDGTFADVVIAPDHGSVTFLEMALVLHTVKTPPVWRELPAPARFRDNRQSWRRTSEMNIELRQIS
jgi:hypothetical protein